MGQNSMDFIITEGRTKVAEDTKELLQIVLDTYGAGVNILSLNILVTQYLSKYKMLSRMLSKRVKMNRDISTKLRLIAMRLYL